MAAKKASAKKTAAKKKTAARTPAVAVKKAPREPAYSLDALQKDLGEPSAPLASMALGSRSDEEFLGLGTEFTSADILESVPRFLGTASAYLASAKSAPVMGVSKGYLALATRESIVLRGMLRDALSNAGGSAVVRRQKLTEATAQARALRDQVLHTLGGLVPAKGKVRDKVLASAGAAPTAETLAVALETLAGVVSSARQAASKAELAAYDELGITGSLGGALNDQAKALREAADVASGGNPIKGVTQRALDLQDGRVLHLVTHIHRAFREAHASSATVVLPPLGRLRRLIDKSASRSEPIGPATP
jgi:hypothetical protein